MGLWFCDKEERKSVYFFPFFKFHEHPFYGILIHNWAQDQTLLFTVVLSEDGNPIGSSIHMKKTVTWIDY